MTLTATREALLRMLIEAAPEYMLTKEEICRTIWQRDAMIEDIENGNTNYQASVYYMDIINQYERMGDFMINISQDLERAFVKR